MNAGCTFCNGVLLCRDGMLSKIITYLCILSSDFALLLKPSENVLLFAALVATV